MVAVWAVRRCTGTKLDCKRQQHTQRPEGCVLKRLDDGGYNTATAAYLPGDCTSSCVCYEKVKFRQRYFVGGAESWPSKAENSSMRTSLPLVAVQLEAARECYQTMRYQLPGCRIREFQQSIGTFFSMIEQRNSSRPAGLGAWNEGQPPDPTNPTICI